MDSRRRRYAASDPSEYAEAYHSKKNETKLIEEFHRLWNQCRPAFSQERCWTNAGELILSNLINFGRHTIAGALSSAGRADLDWSAAYRLFEKQRFDVGKLFDVPRKTVLETLPEFAPVVASLDDTLLRKSGRNVHGTSWRRDPLWPKFSTNFIWSQRWLQISLALPENNGRCRAIPVDFYHCPSAAKPGKQTGEAELAEYRKRQKEQALPSQALRRMARLRKQIPSDRELVISGDGGYTNKTICRNLPDKTTFLGRVRKDAKLFSLPEVMSGRGRKRVYGMQLATPEMMRLDDSIPWHEVSAAIGDKMHTFRIKTVSPVRSGLTGEKDLKLIIVQPLRYRLTQKSRLLYRNPAYIISTDPTLDDADILQWYLWRWEIELNFRDEKNILGLDEVMVRTPDAVETWTPFVVCSYSMLLLAGRSTISRTDKELLPKWQKTVPFSRPSTNRYLSIMRQEIAEMSWKINLNGFKAPPPQNRNPLLFIPDIKQAVIYARK